MNDSTTRFSNRVEQYVRYRPSYPPEIIPFLIKETHLQPSWVIADIGSGTGISSKLFLEYGNTVMGIEPNTEMRTKGEELLRQYSGFLSIDGTAEQTTLQDESVDMVVAGQAFHWFDAAKAQTEFRRIARPGAYCVLIWNERLTVSPFATAYEQLLKDYATDYAEVDHRNVSEEKITAFFAPNNVTLTIFPNRQVFGFEGLQGRLLSSSYVPLDTDTRYGPMLERLQQIFDEYQWGGEVAFEYETKVYTGLLKEISLHS